jgi:hypothetical protein
VSGRLEPDPGPEPEPLPSLPLGSVASGTVSIEPKGSYSGNLVSSGLLPVQGVSSSITGFPSPLLCPVGVRWRTCDES